jgi:hypothetical protein
MPVPIAPLIITATELLVGLVRVAKEAKQLSKVEFEELKKKLDEEFESIPEWDEL